MSASEVEQTPNLDGFGNEFCCESYINLYSIESDGVTIDDAKGNITEIDGIECEEVLANERKDLKFRFCPYCARELKK